MTMAERLIIGSPLVGVAHTTLSRNYKFNMSHFTFYDFRRVTIISMVLVDEIALQKRKL
jgi:hypothetical protein